MPISESVYAFIERVRIHGDPVTPEDLERHAAYGMKALFEALFAPRTELEKWAAQLPRQPHIPLPPGAEAWSVGDLMRWYMAPPPPPPPPPPARRGFFAPHELPWAAEDEAGHR